MVWILLVQIAWTIYITIEGLREANFIHLKRKIPRVQMDIDKFWNVQRLLVLIILTTLITSQIGYIGLLIASSMALITPIVHNSSYFYLRNKLNTNLYKKTIYQDVIEKRDQPSIYLSFKLRRSLAIIWLISQITICFLR